VDRAIEWLIDKAMKAGGAILNTLKGRGSKKDVDQAKKLENQYGPKKAGKISAGLKAIKKEEKKYLTKGNITKKEAEKVAITVKRNHPVFTELVIVDGGDSWNYKYKASEAKIVDTKSKKEENNPPEPPKLEKPKFSNGTKATSFKVNYLKSDRLQGGSPASSNNGKSLSGWEKIQRYGLSKAAKWVKMHLLTAQLGGPAKDSNLTPARGPERLPGGYVPLACDSRTSRGRRSSRRRRG